MEVLEPDLIEDLFRVAFLLSGRRLEALDLLCDTLAEAEARSSQWREGDHRLHWALHRIWTQWSGKSVPRGGEPAADPEILSLEGLWAFLGPQDSRTRACAVLSLVFDLPGAAIARLLGEKNRLVEEWKRDCEAVFSREEAGRGWREGIRGWTLQEAEKLRLQAAVRAPARSRHRFERFLGWLAVLTGAVVLCGWFAWERWTESEQGQVQSNLEQLLDSSDGWRQVEWKNFEGNAGEVEDWLFLNGLEGARLPVRLAEVPPSAGRVMVWRENRVAQVVAASPRSLIWIVPAGAVGVVSAGLRSGEIRTARWTANWTVEGSYVVLVAAVAKGD